MASSRSKFFEWNAGRKRTLPGVEAADSRRVRRRTIKEAHGEACTSPNRFHRGRAGGPEELAQEARREDGLQDQGGARHEGGREGGALFNQDAVDTVEGAGGDARGKGETEFGGGGSALTCYGHRGWIPV